MGYASTRGPSVASTAGKQRHRAGHGQAHDHRAGDADRAQDHELEQDQADQAEQHGQAAEEDGAPGRGDRRGDGIVDRFLVDLARWQSAASARAELLAEPAGQQQRVVDAQAKPKERGQVEDEDAQRRLLGDEEKGTEGHDHRRSTDHDGHAGGDHAAEDQQQGERGERQRDDLAAPQVVLR